jgi:hypothetical protein
MRPSSLVRVAALLGGDELKFYSKEYCSTAE